MQLNDRLAQWEAIRDSVTSLEEAAEMMGLGIPGLRRVLDLHPLASAPEGLAETKRGARTQLRRANDEWMYARRAAMLTEEEIATMNYPQQAKRMRVPVQDLRDSMYRLKRRGFYKPPTTEPRLGRGSEPLNDYEVMMIEDYEFIRESDRSSSDEEIAERLGISHYRLERLLDRAQQARPA